jgi:hypothetical protein
MALWHWQCILTAIKMVPQVLVPLAVNGFRVTDTECASKAVTQDVHWPGHWPSCPSEPRRRVVRRTRVVEVWLPLLAVLTLLSGSGPLARKSAESSSQLGVGMSNLNSLPAAHHPSVWPPVAMAQFSTHLIATSAGARGLSSCDLDNDGDMDLASVGGSLVMWYENVNLGSSWIPHTIPSTISGGTAVYCMDLNNDTLVDVLSTSELDMSRGSVWWYENKGGSPLGWVSHLVSPGLRPAGVFSLDMNKDGE